ncbi:MAG: sugar ABC transporter permease [Thermoanaerobaculia bacterium]|nr:sugar ABC transporter permease [Thermoanaerobaculia bacterium]
MESGSPSHRLRFGIGIGAGAAVAILLGHFLLGGALSNLAEQRETRQGIVTLRALSDLVSRTADGDGLRKAVTEFQKAYPELKSIRVVLLEGASLEASTDPADTGEWAAPRQLSRDEKKNEKPVFDLMQKIRGTVEANREEKTAKEELEIGRLADGSGFSLAGPLEKNGEVTGLVEIKRSSAAAATRPGWITTLLYIAVPILLLVGLSFGVGNKQIPLAICAAVLLIGTIWGYGVQSRSKINREGLAASDAVASTAKTGGERVQSILQGLGIQAEPALNPANWDSDLARRPRAVLTPDLKVDPAKAMSAFAGVGTAVTRATILLIILGVAIALFFGMGWAELFARTLRVHRTAYYYVTPAMVGMIILVFFPFAYGITLSFTDYNIYTTGKPLTEIFNGFQNYVEILTDFQIAKRSADGSWAFNYYNFYWTFFFTIVWTISNVTIGVTLGLILALVLNTKTLALKPIYRVLLVLPWAVPNYITALVWRGMFHQQYGVVNQAIQMFGGSPVSWSDTPFTSFLTALATNGWLSFPFMMVVSLGALQSIPADLYEAARVDGATRWQQFTSITLPSLKPALVPAIILSVVWTFNMFNIIYLVTAGQPAGSTEILITQAYKFAFEKYRYGYAAAYSTVIFGILLVYGVFQNRITKASEGI